MWSWISIGSFGAQYDYQSELTKTKREAVESEEEMALRSYGSRLRYQCGKGRKFLDEDTKELYDERWLQCNWNQTWTRTDSLDPCEWVQCLYPPEVRLHASHPLLFSSQPPKDLNIALQWDSEPVEFNSSVSYTCASEDTYFEWNRTMEEYNVTCQPGGTWEEPKIWPRCLACK